MARMSSARWVGPHHDNGLMSRYDILCFHTIVGYAPAHAAHWSVHGDGAIDQSRDTHYRSAANLNGNHRVLAVETEDHGAPFSAWSGSNVPAWTPAQCESLAKIAVWANRMHGVPLVACPDSKPTSRGIAFHRQGCDGNYPNGRVPGGELWSSSRGKVCPGDRRIAQVPSIIKRARVLAGLEEDDMTPQDLLNHPIARVGSALGGRTTLGAVLANFDRVVEREAARDAALTAAVAALSADPGLDRDVVATLLDDAVQRHTPTADQIATAIDVVQRPHLLAAVRAVLGEDNADQADAIVDEIVSRLSNPNAEGNRP